MSLEFWYYFFDLAVCAGRNDEFGGMWKRVVVEGIRVKIGCHATTDKKIVFRSRLVIEAYQTERVYIEPGKF
jgi:hypothetical protein